MVQNNLIKMLNTFLVSECIELFLRTLQSAHIRRPQKKTISHTKAVESDSHPKRNKENATKSFPNMV